MQGVEIINTIHSYASLIHPAWGTAFCMIGLIICVIGACTTHYDTIQKILFTAVVPVIIGAIVCVVGAFIETDEIVDTRYEVVVSDEVPMAEFYKHYKVIGQDGEIFTVRERK